MPESSDPTDLRSIAVTGEDLVAAIETNRTTGRTAVLRVTPPFSGRMRARLHLQIPDARDDDALHVEPDRLLAADAPTYPRPAETEDALRDDPDVDYTVERHRQRHERTVEAWRSAVLDAVCDTATVDIPDGPLDIDVYVLG